MKTSYEILKELSKTRELVLKREIPKEFTDSFNKFFTGKTCRVGDNNEPLFYAHDVNEWAFIELQKLGI